jgi:hypothetical protein
VYKICKTIVHDASEKKTTRVQLLSTMLAKKKLVVDKTFPHTCPRCLRKKSRSWTKTFLTLVHDASKKKQVVDNTCPHFGIFLKNCGQTNLRFINPTLFPGQNSFCSMQDTDKSFRDCLFWSLAALSYELVLVLRSFPDVSYHPNFSTSNR